MAKAFEHRTVLLREAVAALQPATNGVYVDGTLGGGGHTRALLDASAPGGRVIAFDQDLRAIEHAQGWGKVYGNRLQLVHGNFREIQRALAELSVDRVNGVLCDLGVSSPQLDESERGFSYQQDAALDMRMNKEQSLTAQAVVATYSEAELARLFREYGEEKWSARIAQFIVNARKRQPIETTGELVDIIKAAVPAAARRAGPHPAKRVFQALRIEVNDELGALSALLAVLPDVLKAQGRAAIITFHSLEDRLVKKAFQREAAACVCPPHTPVCVCGQQARLRVISRKAVLPSEEEIADNPRARSAKLRVAERLPF